MNAKHILFRSEAREKILRGASLVADAVRVTLGPKFIRNVAAGAPPLTSGELGY